MEKDLLFEPLKQIGLRLDPVTEDEQVERYRVETLQSLQYKSRVTFQRNPDDFEPLSQKSLCGREYLYTHDHVSMVHQLLRATNLIMGN
jgi:hypothetical protein